MSPNSTSPSKSSNPAGDAALLQVKGNAPLHVKRQCLSLMDVFVLIPEKAYAAKVGQRLNLVQVDIRDGPSQESYLRPTDGDGERREAAMTVFETVVEEGELSPSSFIPADLWLDSQ